MEKVKPFYKDENTILYHADCFKLHYEQLNIQADMVMTDPPYGTTQQSWDERVEWPQFWCMVQKAMLPSATIAFTIDIVNYATALSSSPVPFRYEWYWVKNKATGFLNKSNQPLRVVECIPVFSNSCPVYNPQMRSGTPQNYAVKRGCSPVYGKVTTCESRTGATDRYPVNALYFPVINNDSSERIHSNQKPVELIEHLILTHSNPGDTVFDPFAGSGTTAVAARNSGRKCVLVESDEAMCRKIVARLKGEKPHLKPEGILTIEDFL
jgi:site-specific DNA-methyltransferase (adenine-specific)